MPYHRNPMIKLLYNSIFKHKVLPNKKKYDRKKEKSKNTKQKLKNFKDWEKKSCFKDRQMGVFIPSSMFIPKKINQVLVAFI